MDNNQFNQFNQSNPLGGVPMSQKKMFEYIGLGCSCLGFLLTFIFTIVTCSRGAEVAKSNFSRWKFEFGMSKWIIAVIIGVIIAIAGLVFSILSKEQGANLSKISMIAILVACATIIFAIFTNATICSYNCTMNNELESQFKNAFSSYFN